MSPSSIFSTNCKGVKKAFKSDVTLAVARFLQTNSPESVHLLINTTWSWQPPVPQEIENNRAAFILVQKSSIFDTKESPICAYVHLCLDFRGKRCLSETCPALTFRAGGDHIERQGEAQGEKEQLQTYHRMFVDEEEDSITTTTNLFEFPSNLFV